MIVDAGQASCKKALTHAFSNALTAESASCTLYCTFCNFNAFMVIRIDRNGEGTTRSLSIHFYYLFKLWCSRSLVAKCTQICVQKFVRSN